jgi:hypothetical protein
VTVDDLDQQREQLREQVEREEAQLRRAVEDLKVAVAKPFQIIERLQDNPIPWLLSGALIGLWLGSRMHGNDSNGL